MIADGFRDRTVACLRPDGRIVRPATEPMLRPEFVKMLRCPDDRTALTPADPQVVARLSAAVTAGTLRNRAGELVTRAFDEALVRADGKMLYRIVDRIPILLIDEGIPLTPGESS